MPTNCATISVASRRLHCPRRLDQRNSYLLCVMYASLRSMTLQTMLVHIASWCRSVYSTISQRRVLVYVSRSILSFPVCRVDVFTKMMPSMFEDTLSCSWDMRQAPYTSEFLVRASYTCLYDDDPFGISWRHTVVASGVADLTCRRDHLP